MQRISLLRIPFCNIVIITYISRVLQQAGIIYRHGVFLKHATAYYYLHFGVNFYSRPDLLTHLYYACLR